MAVAGEEKGKKKSENPETAICFQALARVRCLADSFINRVDAASIVGDFAQSFSALPRRREKRDSLVDSRRRRDSGPPAPAPAGETDAVRINARAAGGS